MNIREYVVCSFCCGAALGSLVGGDIRGAGLLAIAAALALIATSIRERR